MDAKKPDGQWTEIFLEAVEEREKLIRENAKFRTALRIIANNFNSVAAREIAALVLKECAVCSDHLTSEDD